MKIAIFGAGYVGCVTAASLASLGHSVWLVEPSAGKLALLRNAQSPIVEPGIEDVLTSHIKKRMIVPVSDPGIAITETEMALLCVGTPSLPDGTTDIRQVQTVMLQIAAALKDRQTPYTIALRSTVPYLFLANQILPDLEQALSGRFGRNVYFALNPEFLREGSALNDFTHPPFVIIGSEHPEAAELLRTLYQGVRAPVHVISLGNASLLKYACNAFHALKIAFTNELSSLSDVFHADAKTLMDLFCQDAILNISSAYLKPGFAYGGSCLPKDLKTLNRLASASAIATPVLHAVEESNRMLIEKALQAISDYGIQKIGLVGLTFKPGTDDFRNSPLVELSERLLGKGFALTIYDPDVDIQKIHGQNLKFIEGKMSHLALHLYPEFGTFVAEAQLLIIGKALPGLDKLIQDIPADRVVLDLTRRLETRQEKPRILHLEEFMKGPGKINDYALSQPPQALD